MSNFKNHMHSQHFLGNTSTINDEINRLDDDNEPEVQWNQTKQTFFDSMGFLSEKERLLSKKERTFDLTLYEKIFNDKEYYKKNCQLLCGKPWPKKELSWKKIPNTIFLEFINLVKNKKKHKFDSKTKEISDQTEWDAGEKLNRIENQDILDFSNKYGMLIIQPMELDAYKSILNVEPIDFWKSEISLMYSLGKSYYFNRSFQFERLNELFKFERDKGRFFKEWFYLDDTRIESVNKIKINIESEEIKGEIRNERTFSQLLSELLIKAFSPRLDFSTQLGYSPKKGLGDKPWFFTELSFPNLLSYIWYEFAKSLEREEYLKICDNNKCKKFFITKMVGMGRYCNDKCRSQSGKEIQVWNSVKGKFLSKGYIGQYEINLEEKRALSEKFDAGLYNLHNKKLVALLEFSHSEITNKSPRFKFKSDQLMQGLQLMKKYFNLNSAFLVNKIGQVFYWDIEKNIIGQEIKEIPHSKDLQQSKIDFKKYTNSKDLDNT